MATLVWFSELSDQWVHMDSPSLFFKTVWVVGKRTWNIWNPNLHKLAIPCHHFQQETHLSSVLGIPWVPESSTILWVELCSSSHEASSSNRRYLRCVQQCFPWGCGVCRGSQGSPRSGWNGSESAWNIWMFLEVVEAPKGHGTIWQSSLMWVKQ